MNILFIDDTGQNKNKYVGIGGVIFQDECINNLFSMFRNKREAYGIPDEEEIKLDNPYQFHRQPRILVLGNET